ncbi:hypothetical protein LJU32_17535 [Pseudomonas sp. B21_DOA]|nr:hypothetical protein LJU32_17535 [Pseudomonas sp. B21_DOA]
MPDPWVERRLIDAGTGEHQQRHFVAGLNQGTGEAHHHFLRATGAEVLEDDQQLFHRFHTW